MNSIGNMHEVRFPNIYILANIVYHILPLTIIIVLTKKAAGFSKAEQSVSNIFVTHHVTSKI